MKRTLHYFTFVTTDQRLRIRIPLYAYVVIVAMLPFMVLVLWLMVVTGLTDAVVLKVQPPMFAVGLLLMLVAWGRWWTFDRKANSVRFTPWRRCSLSAVRGVCVAPHLRRRKYTNYTAYAVELVLQDGKHVRLGGAMSSLQDPARANDFATAIGEWLHLPVTQAGTHQDVPADGSATA